jgi:hypothetical protein
MSTCGLAGCQHQCLKPGGPTVAAAPPCAACNQVSSNASLHPVAPVPRQPTSPPPDFRGYEPPLARSQQPTWQPQADSGVRLSPPEGLTPERPRDTARLQPPDFGLAPATKSPAVDDSSASSSLPVGIPQFASARESVASGLKPLADGLDWLKENRYRVVLYVRQPGENDATDRQQIESRGLKYLSLEVSPETLSKKVVDEFNRFVSDKTNLPLFVYDKDGTLAGGLWYLYFRTTEGATDADARARAGRLGFREDQNGDQRLMWLAIQKYLSQQGK